MAGVSSGTLAQCAAVGIGVDRDNPVTAQVGKGGPQGRGDRGLADTPFNDNTAIR